MTNQYMNVLYKHFKSIKDKIIDKLKNKENMYPIKDQSIDLSNMKIYIEPSEKYLCSEKITNIKLVYTVEDVIYTQQI